MQDWQYVNMYVNIEETEERWMAEIKYYVGCTQIGTVSSKLQPSVMYAGKYAQVTITTIQNST